MGIFDGVLLCSDIDGTLTCGGKIPEDNLKYIRYFMENGGLFTVSTGRYPQFLAESNFGFEPNTYSIVVNGTVICTLDGSEFIYDAKLERDLVFEVTEYAKTVCPDIDYRICDIAYREETNNPDITYDANKIVFILKSESDALELLSELKKTFSGRIGVSRSWPVGVEVIPYGSGKGKCVKKLKEITGSKLLICVGDFENDIDMIEAADIGYAVDNATENVKKAADRITVSCRDCAIAQIIKITEMELKKDRE